MTFIKERKHTIADHLEAFLETALESARNSLKDKLNAVFTYKTGYTNYFLENNLIGEEEYIFDLNSPFLSSIGGWLSLDLSPITEFIEEEYKFNEDTKLKSDSFDKLINRFYENQGDYILLVRFMGVLTLIDGSKVGIDDNCKCFQTYYNVKHDYTDEIQYDHY